MHKGFAFIQFTNPFDARSACLGEDGRTVLGQTLGKPKAQNFWIFFFSKIPTFLHKYCYFILLVLFWDFFLSSSIFWDSIIWVDDFLNFLSQMKTKFSIIFAFWYNFFEFFLINSSLFWLLRFSIHD